MHPIMATWPQKPMMKTLAGTLGGWLVFVAVGGLHTLYFLKKESPDTWAYYSITRILPNSFLAEGHDKSFINRAIAVYRHIVGLPTDAEPPSAP
jgi:hypothetical protein